jgi:hypothetical protein
MKRLSLAFALISTLLLNSSVIARDLAYTEDGTWLFLREQKNKVVFYSSCKLDDDMKVVLFFVAGSLDGWYAIILDRRLSTVLGSVMIEGGKWTTFAVTGGDTALHYASRAVDQLMRSQFVVLSPAQFDQVFLAPATEPCPEAVTD